MKRFLTAAFVTLAAAAGAQAATINNGSFEGRIDHGGSFITVDAGVGTIPGWTVGGHSVDWINGYWNAQEGGKSVDLNGNAAGSISQEISDLVAGASYAITFWLSGNTDGDPTVKSVAVTVDGAAGEFTFDTGADGNTDIPGPMNWKKYVFTFTALAETATLTFASLTPGAYGAAIDNVSIAAVPVPASAPLLLAGLGAFAMLRRKRAA